MLRPSGFGLDLRVHWARAGFRPARSRLLQLPQLLGPVESRLAALWHMLGPAAAMRPAHCG